VTALSVAGNKGPQQHCWHRACRLLLGLGNLTYCAAAYRLQQLLLTVGATVGGDDAGNYNTWQDQSLLTMLHSAVQKLLS
jgi:hypothetical protein